MDYTTLWKDFKQFGEIENINFLKEQKCAFVNFVRVQDAVRSKRHLEGSQKYPRIEYQHRNHTPNREYKQVPENAEVLINSDKPQ